MLPRRETLPAVTAAGVIAVIFASVGILGCGFVLLSLIAVPHLPTDSNAPLMPERTRMLAALIYLFFLAACMAEFIVAINVFRRRNWARIAMLIWAGVMTTMCALGMFSIWLIGAVLPQATAQMPDPAMIMTFLRFFLFFFYGIPLGVGIWWLILFTRPRVATAFQPAVVASSIGAMDASGFPAPATALPNAAVKKFSIPLPIAVIAAFDVSGAVWMILMLFIPLPFQVPFFLFGLQIPNFSYKAFLALLGAAYIAFVVGIFKLRRWGLDSLLIVKAIFFLSGIVSLFNPRFMAAMDDLMLQLAAKNPALPAGQTIFPHHIMESLMAFSYAFGISLLVVMIIYRGRFLKAAAESGR
jgi:hypothetical protein